MNIEQIDRYCDLYEQRLKAQQAGSVEEFLTEQGLPRDERLVAELLRLKQEYGAGGSLDETLQAVAETITLEPLAKGQPAQPVPHARERAAQPNPNEVETLAASDAGGGHIGETISLESAGEPPSDRPANRSLDETEVRQPQSLAATQEWSLDHTLSIAANRPHIDVTTSLKADVAAAADSQSNLVIQRRSIKTAEDSAHQPGDYDLLKLLGKGGMGVVYAARQGSLDRTVALKMLKPTEANNAAARNEFLAEACVTGELEHPNIVPIYDLGRNAEGQFFYAMKRVQGTPWKDVIGAKTLHENLEILLRVSDAIAFAHSKGIVHRDLKPENIMLGGFGEVLVMDWGLAILTDMSRTLGGIRKVPTMGGTPAYMPPEMASGPFERIGPASDIYLLGAILYEITTGLRPHTGKNVTECLYAASRNVIQPTEKKGELVDIALRAMEYEPKDRYPNVQAFQEAIRSYQSHSESITLSTRAAEHLATARQTGEYEDYSRALFGFQQALELWDGNEPAKSGLVETRLAYAGAAKAKGDYDLAAGLLDISLPEQAALRDEIVAAQRERDARQQRLKTYKRIGAALVATFLVVVSGAAFWINLERAEARRQEKLAKDNESEARRQEKLAKDNESEARRQEKLAKDNEAEANKQRDEAKRQETRAETARKAEAYEAYVARIGAAAAKIDENAYDNARELLAAAVPSNPDEEDHRHWEWGRLSFLCQQESAVLETSLPLEAVALHGADHEVRLIAAGGAKGKVKVWDAAGQPIAEIDTAAPQVHALAFSPDGRHLAAGTNDPQGFVKIFEADTGTLVVTLHDAAGRGHTRPVLSVEYSSDGQRLLTSSEDGTAKVWDPTTGMVLSTLHGHRWWVWQARFYRPADQTVETKIVTVSHDGTAIVWVDNSGSWSDAGSIRQSPSFRGHDGPIYAAAFAPDGETVATAGHDQRVLLWRPGEIEEFNYDAALSDRAVAGAVGRSPDRALVGHTAPVRSLDFSRDGRMLISAGEDNAVRVWNVASGNLFKTLRGHGQWVLSARLSPDGREIFSASLDGTVRRWNLAGYEEVRVLGGRVLDGHEDSVLRAEFSRDGKAIVSAGRDRLVKTWDADSGAELHTFREGHVFLVSRVAFSADGKLMASAGVDNTVRLWDVPSGRQLQVLQGTGRGAALAISRDGRLVLTGGPEVTPEEGASPTWLARLWDTTSGALLHELPGHQTLVTAAAISDDGNSLYTGDASGVSFVWDARSGQPRARNAWHSAKIVDARFVDDDQLLLASEDNSVSRWDLQASDQPAQRLVHPAPVLSMDSDHDGRRVLTSCLDGRVRLWDGQTVSVLREFGSQGADAAASQRAVALSPDGQRLLIADARSRTVRLYDVASGDELLFPQTGTELGPFLKLPEHAQLWSAEFLPDGRHVVTVGGDQVRLWEINPQYVQYRRGRMTYSPQGVVASASFSTDGEEIISASWDGTAVIWDASTAQSLRKLGGYHAGPLNWAVFSPDPSSSLALTASDDGTAILWDARAGQFLRRFVLHKGPVRCAAFSPDLTRVLTASDDGTAAIWDINDGGQPLRRLEGHGRPVLQAVFSSDGRRVLSGSADHTAIVWDAASGQPLMTLAGHTAAVNAVAFSPDDRRAVTGSADFNVKVWDVGKREGQPVSSAKELLTLKSHQREVTSVAFSPDGLTIITAAHDDTAILHLAAPWE